MSALTTSLSVSLSAFLSAALTSALSVATAMSLSRTGHLTALVSGCPAVAGTLLGMASAAAALSLPAVAMPVAVLLFFSGLCLLSCRSAAPVCLRPHRLFLFRVLRFHDRLLLKYVSLWCSENAGPQPGVSCTHQIVLA